MEMILLDIFLPQNSKWSFTSISTVIYYCGEGVYQTKSANQKNLRQFSTRTKIFELKSGIILVRSFGKLNQQFNLKQKFSVSSEPKKTQFLRFMT